MDWSLEFLDAFEERRLLPVGVLAVAVLDVAVVTVSLGEELFGCVPLALLHALPLLAPGPVVAPAVDRDARRRTSYLRLFQPLVLLFHLLELLVQSRELVYFRLVDLVDLVVADRLLLQLVQ